MASVSLVFLFAKKIQIFSKKVLTKWLRYGIIVLRIETRKEHKMSKKVKIHISLATEIYEKGKAEADKMGIPFSTYLSVLIAKDTTEKRAKTR